MTGAPHDPFGDLRSMTGAEFEAYLEHVFTLLGFDVRRTPLSNDRGADLILSRGNQRMVVQAKLWEASVGVDAVQEAHTAAAAYKCNCCAVITNSEFTSAARALAEAVGCTLLNGTKLRQLVD